MNRETYAGNHRPAFAETRGKSGNYTRRVCAEDGSVWPCAVERARRAALDAGLVVGDDGMTGDDQ